MNTISKIAKESTITFSGMIYGNINRYLYTAILARWVGTEYLGVYSLANAIMIIIEMVSKMGLETGIMRFVSRLDIKSQKKEIKSIIESALKMVIIFSLALSIILIFFSTYLVEFFNGNNLLKKTIIIFACAIPFNVLTLIAAFATQGFKLLKYKVLITQFLNPSILLLTMIVIISSFSKELAIMLPMFITAIIGCFSMLIILRNLSGINIKSTIDAKFNRDLLRYSIPLMLVSILQVLMHWMDILMLGYFTDASTVGLYHPAARTAGLLQALLLSFMSIYAPMISEMHSKQNFEEIERIYKLITRWLITFSIPISIILILFSSKVLLIFGSEYTSGATVLRLLTLGAFFQIIFGAAGPLLSMSGYTKLVFFNSLMAFVLNFILNIILIPLMGLNGAALSTLITMIVLGFARTIEVKLIFQFSFLTKSLFKPILSSILLIIIILFIRPFLLSYHTLITLLLSFFISILIFSFFLWFLKLEPEDIDFYKGLKIVFQNKK
jgi:O-antigen/teichoic acid export membrane protein